MSATTSATYDPQSWSNDDQQRAGITAGASDFSPEQWTGQNFDTMSDATYYSPMLYQDQNGHSFGHAGNAFDNSGLHPTNSLTSSTTHDAFSPSEYASDAAVFGDALSDYGTPGFNHAFPNYQDAQLTQTISPSSLLSSPEPTSAHTLPPNMHFHNTLAQQLSHENLFQPIQQVTSNPQIQVNNSSTSTQKPSRPHLVVTVEEHEDSSSNHENIQPARRRNSSKAHLSPYPDEDDSSDDENDNDLSQAKNEQTSKTPTNHVAPPHLGFGGSIRTGVNPDGRAGINSEEIPSLDDIEKQQRLEEIKHDVEDWLSASDVGSNAGDDPHSRPRRSKMRRQRAKSTNDRPFGAPNPQNINGRIVPGPGLTLNEPSELDEDEEYGTDSRSDSLGADLAPHGEADSYFFSNDQAFDRSPEPVRPVGLRGGDDMDKAVAGITSNIAIMRFRQRAQEADSASVTATLGSRRLSESDIGSVLGAAGISKLLLSPEKSARAPRRKNSFLGNILPNLNMPNSNKLKRKNSQPVEKAENALPSGLTSPKDTQGGFPTPRRIGSFGRPKTPKVDTAIPATANEVKSPKGVAGTATGMVKQIWRSRSRSDLGKSPKMGLAELMTQHGGPPMPTLVSPMQTRPEPVAQVISQMEDDSGDEDGGVGADGLTMDLAVRTDMNIIPTFEGFKFQTRELNPRVADFLLDRVATEQVKRYKRLIEGKTKHNEQVGSGRCNAKGFCLLSGGSGQDLPPRPGNKDPDSALVGFQIMRPGVTEDDLDMGHDGQTMVAAQFPSGVPLPPVARLPAEFECSLCFKVKKFYKPSDWTKHVHEDLQPFTCTFPNCNESKPFKRKADWVRHENERHRQLESWVCSVQECNHTCYRKDNFVQHLVREHKVADPKVRTGRAVKSGSENATAWANAGGEDLDDVWALVDKCRKDSPKQPKDEPCKFCGNICTSWKKLTVHLAKHMEQISMPVLPLVERQKASDTIMNQRTQIMPQPMPMTTRPLNELPTFLYAEPTSFEAEPQSMLGVDQTYLPTAMHTYPPANLSLSTQLSPNQADLTPTALSLANASYPPPSLQSRSRGSSFASQDYPRQQQQGGTTYPPANMHSCASPPQYDTSQQNQMYYAQQSGGMYMQEPLQQTVGHAHGHGNVYLTPTSNTPASMGFSPGSSTHSLHQAFGFQGQ
jgi:hypothetical protein